MFITNRISTFLVTNWHVVTGKSPETGEFLEGVLLSSTTEIFLITPTEW
jgi:hypothetical protein